MSKILRRWCDQVQGIGTVMKDGLLNTPWYDYVRAVITKVTDVDAAISSRFRQNPVLLALSSSLHVVGGVACVVCYFGVLVHQLKSPIGGPNVARTKVLVQDAFEYLEERLRSLDKWVQKVDEMGLGLGNLLIDDADARTLARQLFGFALSVEQCRLDIADCLAKINDTIPWVKESIEEVKSARRWPYISRLVFGAAGAGGLIAPGVGWIVVGACAAQSMIQHNKVDACDTLLVNFLEFLVRSKCIVNDLTRVEIRLTRHQEAVRWLLQQELHLTSLEEAENVSRRQICQSSCNVSKYSDNSYISIIVILCMMLLYCGVLQLCHF